MTFEKPCRRVIVFSESAAMSIFGRFNRSGDVDGDLEIFFLKLLSGAPNADVRNHLKNICTRLLLLVKRIQKKREREREKKNAT